MPVSVNVGAPGRVGDIGDDWSIKLDAMPNSPLQGNGSTGEVSFSSSTKLDSHLSMNNTSIFTYSSPLDEPADPTQDGSGNVYAAATRAQLTTALNGIIDSVSVQGGQTSFTQGTQFTQFATTDIDIPWVSSGSTLAAFDLAWQLAGNRRCTLNYQGGRYWSLRGHDAGFDADGKQAYPADYSTYKMNPSNNGTYFRNWDLRNSYASTQWSAAGAQGVGEGSDLFSFAGMGSSPTVNVGSRTSIAFKVPNSGSGNKLVFNYGDGGAWDDKANGYSQQWGFGPWQGSFARGTGKVLNFGFNVTTKNSTVNMTYMDTSTNSQKVITNTIDLSSLSYDPTYRTKIVTDTWWVNNNTFRWSLWFQDYTGKVVYWTSGDVTTGKDLYAKPWTHIGSINGLYQVTAPGAFQPTMLLTNYENVPPMDTTLWSGTGNGGLPAFGSLDYDPILPYTGSLWDYLNQVCTAKEHDFRIRAGRYYISQVSESIASPKAWNSISEPTFSLDNQNVADTVEIVGQLVDLRKQPTIYDTRQDSNQTYSFNAGEINTFTITTNFVGTAVLNPEPVYSYSDFASKTPWGGYIVSGADNLPIPAEQWVTYGGSVTVRQTGPQTLEVTVTAPYVATANGDGGTTVSDVASYYFGVSDGSNQYGCFTLTGGAGDVIEPVTRTYQTGSSYAQGNSSPGSVTNPCATSLTMMNTLATQAANIASGPNVQLSGVMSIGNLQTSAITDIGLVPGMIIYYRNLAWRLLSATFQEGNVSFSASPLVTYNSAGWVNNWSGRTTEEFTAFWNGKNYDDMKSMLLSGILDDYVDTGRVRKFSVYPGGGTNGELAIYPGIETYPGGNVVADR